MQQRRSFLHGGAHVDDGFQHFVIHVDEGQCRFCDVGIVGGDGGDGVAAIQRLVGCQEVIAEELETVVVVAQLCFAQGRKGQVGGGHHGADAGQSLGLAGINRPDAGVGVGAAEDTALQQPGQVEIGPVLSPGR